MYGIPGERTPSVKQGDRIFIWMGAKGYIAEAVVTGDPRPPKSSAEAPWPGGTYTFGWVFPFDLVREVKQPVSFPFTGQRQDKTGVSKSGLQRSLTIVSPEGAEVIHAGLLAQAHAEAHGNVPS